MSERSHNLTSARHAVAAHPHARQDLRGVSRQEGGEEHDLRDCGTLH